VPLFVADSGLYSAENVERLSAAGVCWISRVSETPEQARSALQVADDARPQEGDLFWASSGVLRLRQSAIRLLETRCLVQRGDE
jgi:hypothetical protein